MEDLKANNKETSQNMGALDIEKMSTKISRKSDGKI